MFLGWNDIVYTEDQLCRIHPLFQVQGVISLRAASADGCQGGVWLSTKTNQTDSYGWVELGVGFSLRSQFSLSDSQIELKSGWNSLHLNQNCM